MMSSPLDQAIDLLTTSHGHGDGDGDGDHNAGYVHQDDDRSSRLRSFLRSGNEDPMVDSVLSMLGFTNTSVHRSYWNISGTTLATILSTCIASETKLLFHSFESVQTSTYLVKSSIFVGDVVSNNDNPQLSEYGFEEPKNDLKEFMGHVIFLLKGTTIEEPLALELLELLLKAISIISSMKLRHSGGCLLYEREHNTMVSAPSFMCPLIQFALAKREVFYNRFSSTTRLLLWRLQPDLLLEDLSAILQKISHRPLLPLKHELRHIDGWYNLVLGLVSGPDIFLKARTVLNGWLLAAGASCLFDLKEGLGAAVLDVLEHPSSWGLCFEAGTNLPPLSAFYHVNLQSSVKILMRAPTFCGLKELLDLITRNGSQYTRDDRESQCEDLANSTLDTRAMTCTEMDLHIPDSLWMLLLEFPIWLQFASFLLFLRPNILLEDCDGIALTQKLLVEDRTSSGHREIAASYISWNFSPHDNKLRDLVVRMLFEIVENWQNIKDKGGGNSEEISSRIKRRRLMKINKEDKTIAKVDQHEILRRKDAVIIGTNEHFWRDGSEVLFYEDAVNCWLMNFRDSCHLLDTHSQVGSHHTMEPLSKYQANRALLNENSESTLAYSSHIKMSSFFSTFPLIALSCSPELQNRATIDIVLHFVLSGYGCLFSKVNGIGIMEARQGISCREPSHRTEDYRDLCMDPFCRSFSAHASSGIAASAVARVFKFLETLDIIYGSLSLECVDGFKEMIINQLMVCIRRWREDVMNAECVTVLDDFRHRAGLWINGAELQNATLRAFNQVLQDLDVVSISSSSVDV